MDLILKFEFLGNVEKEEFMSIIYQEETLTLKCMYTDFVEDCILCPSWKVFLILKANLLL